MDRTQTTHANATPSFGAFRYFCLSASACIFLSCSRFILSVYDMILGISLNRCTTTVSRSACLTHFSSSLFAADACSLVPHIRSNCYHAQRSTIATDSCLEQQGASVQNPYTVSNVLWWPNERVRSDTDFLKRHVRISPS